MISAKHHSWNTESNTDSCDFVLKELASENFLRKTIFFSQQESDLFDLGPLFQIVAISCVSFLIGLLRSKYECIKGTICDCIICLWAHIHIEPHTCFKLSLLFYSS